jgi:hypothetical protein
MAGGCAAGRAEGKLMTLEWEIHVLRNPYAQTVPDTNFIDLVRRSVEARAADVDRRSRSGEFGRNSMGFVVLDPTAPRSRPSNDVVLLAASVGPEGARFIPNASAKAFEHWDLGSDCGALVYTQNHRLADGQFGFGFSAELDGTIVGASGESELQDRFQAVSLAAELNYRIGAARSVWEEAGKQEWYSVPSSPGVPYTEVWRREGMAKLTGNTG